MKHDSRKSTDLQQCIFDLELYYGVGKHQVDKELEFDNHFADAINDIYSAKTISEALKVIHGSK